MNARAFALLLPVLVTGACTYAWPIGEELHPDGSVPVDATIEAGADAQDASSEEAEDASGDDAPVTDGRAGDAPNCAQLQADLKQKRAAARACFHFSGECTSAQLDECGCKVFVEYPQSFATMQYQDAVSAYLAAGCPRQCTTACSNAVLSTCAFDDGGVTSSCTP